jgi:hypothetical protein
MHYVRNSEVLNPLSFNHCYWACSIQTKKIQNLGFDTRVELNIIFTFVVVVVENEEAHG